MLCSGRTGEPGLLLVFPRMLRCRICCMLPTQHGCEQAYYVTTPPQATATLLAALEAAGAPVSDVISCLAPVDLTAPEHWFYCRPEGAHSLNVPVVADALPSLLSEVSECAWCVASAGDVQQACDV